MGRSENVNRVRRILLLAAGRPETREDRDQLEIPFAPPTVPTKSSATNEELIGIGLNLHKLALELVWLLQMEAGGLVRSPIRQGRRRLRLGALPSVRILEEWDARGEPNDSPQENLLSSPLPEDRPPGTLSSETSKERSTATLALEVDPPQSADETIEGAPLLPSRTREQAFLDGLSRARTQAGRLSLGGVELSELIRRLYTLVLATKAEDDLAGLIHGHGQRHRLERTPRGKLAFKVDRDRSRGQGFFTTPPALIQELTRAIIDPAMETGADDQLFLDPACGSGQFMLAAARRYCTRRDQLRRLNHIHGVDIDPIAARIAAHNLSLWAAEFVRAAERATPTSQSEGKRAAPSQAVAPSIGSELDAHFGLRFPYFLGTQVQVGNSLLIEASSFSPGFIWEKRFPGAFDRKRPGFDVVLGNPPWVSFGLRDRTAADEDERAYFERLFPAGTQYKLTLYPLFIELALRLCRPGGYHGFLVPDSVLTGHHFSRIRECLVTQAELKELTLVESAPWPGAHVGFTVFYSARKKQSSRTTRAGLVRNRVLRATKKRRAPSLLCPREDATSEADGRFVADEVWVPAAQYTDCAGAPLRVFRNRSEMEFLIQIQKSPFRFGQVIWTYSGLIARYGQKSVQADRSESRFLLRDQRGIERYRDDRAAKRWGRSLWSGSEVTPYRIEWQGGRVYIPEVESDLSSVYKSGFDLSRYRRPKVFLRQTGDRLIAGLDREGFFCLNNLHLLGGDEHYRVPPLLLVGALMSRPVQDTYRIFALEGARPLAQVDLKTVESLPYPVDASGFPLGGGDSPPRTHPQSRRILRSIDRWLKVEDSDPILELVNDARELGPDPYREGPLLGRDVLALVFLRLLELREEEIADASPVPKRRRREKARTDPESALQDLLDEMFALVFGVKTLLGSGTSGP